MIRKVEGVQMKKIVSITFSMLLIIGLLAGCGTSDKVEDTNDDKKVLKMGTSADYPPFETFDAVSGEIVGFDIDLVNYIANELGYELEIEDMKFDGLIGALQADRVDFVASGMSATEERKKSVDFSTEYHKSGELIVTLKDTPVTSVDDLAGKKLGVQLGTIQEEGAKKLAEQYEGLEIKSLDKVPDLIQELKSNRIDAVYLDQAVALGYINGLDLVGFEDANDSTPGLAIAFPKGNEDLVAEFNKVIEEMMENGKLEELEKKWLEESK